MPVEVGKTLVVPFGTLQLRACSQRLTGVIILAGPGTALAPAAAADDATLAVLEQARQQFAEYFLGRRRKFTVPLDLSGLPPFTRQVLSLLRAVPYGTTVTYAELAARASNPGAARAVGRAMAVNPLPIVIPCHRVIAAGGRLGGYSGAGGVRTKEWLLAFEQNNRL